MVDTTRRECTVRRLGRVAYADALRLQEASVAARQSGAATDTLFLLEHDKVLTLGRNSHAENILLDHAALRARGFETFEVGRGGDVTYHGPGQLVGYPILALEGEERDAHRYLRALEELLLRTLADFGIAAFRHPPHTGVWVEHEGAPRKIAALGVRFARWVSSHGFALNVHCDLRDFDVIVPCGIRDHGVTSMEQVLGREVTLDEVQARVIAHAGAVLDRELRLIAPDTSDSPTKAAV